MSAMASDTETRLFLPCGCAGSCTILAVDRFSFGGEGDPEDWYFELYTRAHTRSGLRYRLGLALKVLLNRDHYLDSLIFSDAEIQPLRDFIDTRLSSVL